MTFKVGDKVKVRPGKEHEGMGEGEVGEVKLVNGTALGIKFPSEHAVHKWYTEDELLKEGAMPNLVDRIREATQQAIREAGLSTAFSDGTERGGPGGGKGGFPPSTTEEDGGQTRTPNDPGNTGGAKGEMRGAAQAAGRAPFSTGGPAPFTTDGYNASEGSGAPGSINAPSEHVSDAKGGAPTNPVGVGQGPTTVEWPITTNPPMLDGYDSKVKEAAAASVHAHAHAHGHMHAGGQSHGHPHTHMHDHHHGRMHESVEKLREADPAVHVHEHDHMHTDGTVHTHQHGHGHSHTHGDARMKETVAPGVRLMEALNIPYASEPCATCSHPKCCHIVIAGDYTRYNESGTGQCRYCAPKGSMHTFTDKIDFTPTVVTVPLHSTVPNNDPGDIRWKESTFVGSERDAHMRMFSDAEQAQIRLDHFVEAMLGPYVEDEQSNAARERAKLYNAHSVAAHRQTLNAFMTGQSAQHSVAADHHELASNAADKASNDYPDGHQAKKDFKMVSTYHSHQAKAHRSASEATGRGHSIGGYEATRPLGGY